MSDIQFVERPMTDVEFARMNSGFDENTLAHNNPTEVDERHGFVLHDGDLFIGCASGLAKKSRADGTYNRWFYLTDLFVEAAYRGQGLGADLLRRLENRVAAIDGVTHIWAWTAGYEAPGFYQKQGYEIFAELENSYASGHSRIALRKVLRPELPTNE